LIKTCKCQRMFAPYGLLALSVRSTEVRKKEKKATERRDHASGKRSGRSRRSRRRSRPTRRRPPPATAAQRRTSEDQAAPYPPGAQPRRGTATLTAMEHSLPPSASAAASRPTRAGQGRGVTLTTILCAGGSSAFEFPATLPLRLFLSALLILAWLLCMGPRCLR
jgi:hypothetical protein